MKKKIERSEFDDIMSDHAKWLYNRSEGKRACFYDFDLSKMSFSNERLVQVDFTGADLTHCVFKSTDLSCSSFKFAKLDGCKILNSTLLESNFAYATMTNAVLKTCDFHSSNLSNANLSDSDLENSDLWNCVFNGTYLTNCNLKGVRIGSPTMILLANWGELSDELTTLAMAYDASCHQDKKSFEDWSKWGSCPYKTTNYDRACKFVESRQLWNSEIKVPGAFELMIKIIREKCANSDWHDQTFEVKEEK